MGNTAQVRWVELSGPEGMLKHTPFRGSAHRMQPSLCLHTLFVTHPARNRTSPTARYRYDRAWWAAILGSPITLGCVFITVLASFIFVLGFVPMLGR